MTAERESVYYFSNNTESEFWMAHNCYECLRDHDQSHGDPAADDGHCGCPAILSMLDGTYNPALYRDKYDRLHCSAFTPCIVCDPPGEKSALDEWADALAAVRRD